MATTPASISATEIALLIPTLYSKLTLKLAQGKSIIEKAGFIGSGGMPILKVTELNGASAHGDRVRIKGLKSLSGAGVTGDTQMEGSEEEMVYSRSDCVIDQFRNAVKTSGKLAMKKLTAAIEDDMAPQLADWIAHRKDVSFISALAMPPTGTGTYDETDSAPGALNRPNLVLRPDGVSSWDNLTQGKLTVAMLKKLNVLAMARGIKPLSIPGIAGTVSGVLIITPGQLYDLQNDPDYERSNELAQMRGSDNPVFTGAVYLHSGVLIRVDSHTDVLGSYMQATAGTGLEDTALGNAGVLKNSSLLYQDVTGADFDKVQSLFVGANAVGFADLGNLELTESDDTDYRNKFGLCVSQMWSFRKTTINRGTNASLKTCDFGVIYVETIASKLAVVV